MKKIILFVIAGLFAGSAFAQSTDKAKLNQYFDVLEANNKFMGSVQVSKDGKAIYARSNGWADTQDGKKTAADSKFRIGSISKTFTAALILKAAEEKKLSLDDKLDKYFPTIPNASKITIKNLLNHSSGIHNFTNDEAYMTYNTSPKTQAEMVDIIVKAGSDFEPGAKNQYSNSGYVLLGFIVEKAYKKPYKDVLTDKITKPLGLKNTYFGGKINTASNEVNSFDFNGKWNKSDETDMSIPGGAGAIVSTPADLSKFLEGLFAGKIISAASLEQMKTMTNKHGLGLFEFPYEQQKLYGHNGGIDGFQSMLVYAPESKITVAITSNGTTISPNDVGLTLLDWANNTPFDIPEYKTFAYTEQELDQYTGYYESKQIPLAITITRNGNILSIQVKGQPAFPLDSAEKGVFTSEGIGLELEFNPAEKSMVLKQRGATFTFTKQ